MAFLARSGTDAKERSGLHGEYGALEVAAVGGAAQIAVTVTYPHARSGDTVALAALPAGAAAPDSALASAHIAARTELEFLGEDTAVTAALTDLAAGDYDLYYRAVTAAGPATDWTNLATAAADSAPAPIPVAVGRAATHDITDTAAMFGGAGTVIDL